MVDVCDCCLQFDPGAVLAANCHAELTTDVLLEETANSEYFLGFLTSRSFPIRLSSCGCVWITCNTPSQ